MMTFVRFHKHQSHQKQVWVWKPGVRDDGHFFTLFFEFRIYFGVPKWMGSLHWSAKITMLSHVIPRIFMVNHHVPYQHVPFGSIPHFHTLTAVLGQAATYIRKMWLGARTRSKYFEPMEEFGRRGVRERTTGDSWVALSCAAWCSQLRVLSCWFAELLHVPIQSCSSSRKSQVDDTMMDPYSGGLAYRSGLESGNRGS